MHVSSPAAGSVLRLQEVDTVGALNPSCSLERLAWDTLSAVALSLHTLLGLSARSLLVHKGALSSFHTVAVGSELDTRSAWALSSRHVFALSSELDA